jgi:uncharacterized protein (DUF427 family)
MGLSWQQGPLGKAAVGRFLVAEDLPVRMLYVEPLRRRMRVRLGVDWVADSEEVLLLHEPGRYPVAWFPRADVAAALEPSGERTEHPELGATTWLAVRTDDRVVERGAWEHPAPPEYAAVLRDRVAFVWRAMDGFYEEDERVLGHAADPYHRVDIRSTSRHLVVRVGERVVADTNSPLALYETGFTTRWYVPAADVDAGALVAAEENTFCPYKGVADLLDVAGVPAAAWTYPDPYPEAARVGSLVCFDPERVEVSIDGRVLGAEPDQLVITSGADRDLTPAEAAGVRGRSPRRDAERRS